jgi:hypothetical protein
MLPFVEMRSAYSADALQPDNIRARAAPSISTALRYIFAGLSKS